MKDKIFNILWITNILFPEASALLSGNKELKASGGWMLGAAKALITYHPNVKLNIASLSSKVRSLRILSGEYFTYYILPLGKGNIRYNKDYEAYWKDVQKLVKPDIVHIHGSEFTHGLAYVNVCGNRNVVLSIQGLRTAIRQYYFKGLSKWDIFSNITFFDLIKGDTLIKSYLNYVMLSRTETELFKKLGHIIGRTSWDRAHAFVLNPNAKYHFCNETLRPEFYSRETWSYDKCDKHTIFLSQAAGPIKGLHQLLKALPIILRYYPDTKIKIAGPDITLFGVPCRFFKISGYGRIISKYMKKYKVQGHVIYLGRLNGEEMRKEYLSANVFVMPSTVENSPNSLGEAQMLGVPHVASYVGGAADMMKGNEDNLYRFEEVNMLAYKICRIFANKDNQVSMKDEALRRHDPHTNSDHLYEIYCTICKEVNN